MLSIHWGEPERAPPSGVAGWNVCLSVRTLCHKSLALLFLHHVLIQKWFTRGGPISAGLLHWTLAWLTIPVLRRYVYFWYVIFFGLKSQSHPGQSCACNCSVLCTCIRSGLPHNIVHSSSSPDYVFTVLVISKTNNPFLSLISVL